jgi:hypothetical protein
MPCTPSYERKRRLFSVQGRMMEFARALFQLTFFPSQISMIAYMNLDWLFQNRSISIPWEEEYTHPSDFYPQTHPQA